MSGQGGDGWDQVMRPNPGPPALGPGGGAPGFGHAPPPVSPPFLTAKTSGYQPTPEELTYALWAHLLGAIAMLICCGAAVPVAAPLLAMTMTKERGPFLMFHVNQAVVFQLGIFVTITAISVVSGLLMLICVGYVTIFAVLIPWAMGMIYPLVVGFAAKGGDWAEYPFAGPKTLQMVSPPFK